jgi:uncharacterized protein YecT (DUF1311 family)
MLRRTGETVVCPRFTLLLILPACAQAASFDCTKPVAKVEQLICADPEISRLDEEMSAAYKTVLQDQAQAKAAMAMQKMWLEVRDDCTDPACLKTAYQARIRELHPVSAETGAASGGNPDRENKYVLKMSKDDELCNHMLQLFNEDLARYGWDGDSRQEEHDEFRRVPWQPGRVSAKVNGHVEQRYVEGALFDFNNDGVQDFLVRWKATLSGVRSDYLVLLDSEMADKKTDLAFEDFSAADDQINLSVSAYHLLPPYTVVVGMRVLEPFIYHDTAYLVMRPLFEATWARSSFAVIARYDSGRFINQELTGKMEDVCYYWRDRGEVNTNKQK